MRNNDWNHHKSHKKERVQETTTSSCVELSYHEIVVVAGGGSLNGHMGYFRIEFRAHITSTHIQRHHMILIVLFHSRNQESTDD